MLITNVYRLASAVDSFTQYEPHCPRHLPGPAVSVVKSLQRCRLGKIASLISAVAMMRLPKPAFAHPQPSVPCAAAEAVDCTSTEWSMNSFCVFGLIPKSTVGIAAL
jgi:hypothetical protein